MGYNYQRARVQTCKDCGIEVDWRPTNDGRLNKKGQPLQLPFEVATGQQHRCQAYLDRVGKDYRRMSTGDKAKGIECKFCKGNIMFSADQRSASGKMIPLEMDGSTPHECPAREPYRGGGRGGTTTSGGTRTATTPAPRYPNYDNQRTLQPYPDSYRTDASPPSQPPPEEATSGEQYDEQF